MAKSKLMICNMETINCDNFRKNKNWKNVFGFERPMARKWWKSALVDPEKIERKQVYYCPWYVFNNIWSLLVGFSAISWNFEFPSKSMEAAPLDALKKLQDLFPSIKQYSRLTVVIEDPTMNARLVRFLTLPSYNDVSNSSRMTRILSSRLMISWPFCRYLKRLSRIWVQIVRLNLISFQSECPRGFPLFSSTRVLMESRAGVSCLKSVIATF